MGLKKKKEEVVKKQESKDKMASLSNDTGVILNRKETKDNNLNKESALIIE